MNVTIYNRDFRRVLNAVAEIETRLAQLLSNQEITFFIELPTNEEMSITLAKRGSTAIYKNNNDPYVVLDASRTPVWDAKMVNFYHEGHVTPLRANIVIKKRDVRIIVREFCVSGTLSSDVYWLREGTEPS